MKYTKMQDTNENDNPMTEQEKSVLMDRIYKTIRIHRSRKRNSRYFIGAAATLGLLVCLGNYIPFPAQPEQSITDYVNTSKNFDHPDPDNITLVLGEGEGVKIDEEIPEVQYSVNGKKVTIGKARSIDQKISEGDKPIYNTLFVPYGKRSKLLLSDGSVVWMNSGSKLIYPAKFDANKREVYIEGEAIFEVAHNGQSPFYVISGNQKVKVLGTVFGVSNYTDENSISTILKTGSVEISYFKNPSFTEPIERMRITPGTRSSYNKKSKAIVSEKVNVDSYFSWKEGFFVFKNDNLEYILKRISRYYNVEIKISGEPAENETFSGYLNLNDDVETVLESIKESTNLDYEITK